jgi:hypothetical protein
MKKFLVETVVTYRMRYVIEAEDEFHAETQVINGITTGGLKEFSQKHLGEEIFTTRKLKKKAYIELFDTDNDYLKQWPLKMKYELINRNDSENKSTEW